MGMFSTFGRLNEVRVSFRGKDFLLPVAIRSLKAFSETASEDR